jgi:hypothetical protein|tara:strand:+ start:175 stop:318 length:144 start_codon:yes stop_codon:yes gene_type:complete
MNTNAINFQYVYVKGDRVIGPVKAFLTDKNDILESWDYDVVYDSLEI